MKYRDFQVTGIQFLLTKKRCILADEMGLGKTIQAIGLLNELKAEKVLIICPAVVKINWKLELEKWLNYQVDINIINGSKSHVTNGINIINYDIVRKYQLALMYWDVIILDEAHYIKSYKSQRTRAIKGDGRTCQAIEGNYKILLTGTPLLNCPVELYPMLTYIGFRMRFVEYTTKFCNRTKIFGRIDVSGASNLTELKTILNSYMLRRLKKDVLSELPDKTRQNIVFTANGTVRKLMDEELRLAGSRKPADLAEFTRIRQETGILKIPFAVQHLNDLLEEKKKIVVFAHHRSVINQLHQLFCINSLMLTGETQDRQYVINQFIENDEINILFMSLKVGIGINLTVADIAVFVEIDMTPATNWQCEDRIHRIGQLNNVLIQYLLFEGKNTIDKQIVSLIEQKKEIIEEVGL